MDCTCALLRVLYRLYKSAYSITVYLIRFCSFHILWLNRLLQKHFWDLENIFVQFKDSACKTYCSQIATFDTECIHQLHSYVCVCEKLKNNVRLGALLQYYVSSMID